MSSCGRVLAVRICLDFTIIGKLAIRAESFCTSLTVTTNTEDWYWHLRRQLLADIRTVTWNMGRVVVISDRPCGQNLFWLNRTWLKADERGENGHCRIEFSLIKSRHKRERIQILKSTFSVTRKINESRNSARKNRKNYRWLCFYSYHQIGIRDRDGVVFRTRRMYC